MLSVAFFAQFTDDMLVLSDGQQNVGLDGVH